MQKKNLLFFFVGKEIMVLLSNTQSMPQPKSILTFKVDSSIADALSKVKNRSEFIRAAISAALKNSCPFCAGSGVLSMHQKKHWEQMLEHHHLFICKTCKTPVIQCKNARKNP